MDMQKCPHCGEAGITTLRKQFLGPATSTKCKICGKRVSVPFWSLVGVLPFIVSIPLVSILLSEEALLAYVLGGLTMCVAFVVLNGYVPLVKRG